MNKFYVAAVTTLRKGLISISPSIFRDAFTTKANEEDIYLYTDELSDLSCRRYI